MSTTNEAFLVLDQPPQTTFDKCRADEGKRLAGGVLTKVVMPIHMCDMPTMDDMKPYSAGTCWRCNCGIEYTWDPTQQSPVKDSSWVRI